MNLSTNYSRDIRDLLSPSAPKKRSFFLGPLDVRSHELSKFASSLHIALGLKIFSNLFHSTLRIGS